MVQKERSITHQLNFLRRAALPAILQEASKLASLVEDRSPLLPGLAWLSNFAPKHLFVLQDRLEFLISTNFIGLEGWSIEVG